MKIDRRNNSPSAIYIVNRDCEICVKMCEIKVLKIEDFYKANLCIITKKILSRNIENG